MKLPITDQFLWDLYYAAPSMESVIEFILSPRAKKLSLESRDPTFERYRKERGAKKFAKLIYYLKTKNYIRVKNLESKKAIILTKDGINKILKASFVMEEKKRRKDGKWIMLTFDMPEKNKRARSLMRSVLQNLGYKMFQQSIWITPYDVSEKTEKLLQFHNLDQYAKIFLIEKI